MELNISPETYQQALAQLVGGSIVAAISTLHQAGIGIAAAKAWVEGLAASENPLEAAVGKACAASQRDHQAEAEAEAARAEENLMAALNYDFPPLMLDKELDQLFSGSVLELDYARTRAAHLCRLANSFCLMHRQGQISAEEAQALIRGGSPGFQDFSYERVWQNAWAVTDREFAP